MHKTKTLIFLEELFLEMGLRLKWLCFGAILSALIGFGILAGLYTFYHFILYFVRPGAMNISNWLQTSNGLYSFGSEDYLPTLAVYLESKWDIYISWSGLRSILDWIPFILIPITTMWISLASAAPFAAPRMLAEQQLKQLRAKQVKEGRRVDIEIKRRGPSEAKQDAREKSLKAIEQKKESSEEAWKNLG